MIAIINRLPVKEGAADRVVERFAGSGGSVQGFPGFVSMEVLRSDGGDEVLVITRWEDRESFDAWVGSDEFRPPAALTVPKLTLTTVKQADQQRSC